MFSLVVPLTLLLLNAGVQGRSRQSCVQSKKIDLQLIVDSSGSVGNKAFHLMLKKIADNVLEEFDIGKDQTRVALFKYSSQWVMVNEFGLNSYNDISSLKKAVNAVNFEPGWTNTAEAMQKSFNFFSKAMRHDQYTTKICIVFTDGQATDSKQVPAASKAWRAQGIKVFAVGIGNGIDLEGLKDIAGSKERVIQAFSFEEIGKIAKTLLVKVCKQIPAHPCDTPDKGGCEQICHKNGDEGYCSCLEGYRLAKNKRSCVKAFDLQEVVFSGGQAGATSFYSPTWAPANAFKPQMPVNKGWKIGRPPKSSYPHNCPVYIWYDFRNNGITPSELSLQPAESSPQGAPSMYQFVGTNDAKCDDNSNWMILCEDLSDRPWRSYYEVRYCKVQRELSGQKFRCLGIRVLNNRRSNGWTSIRNIRMWMRIDGAKDEL